jgi:GNAT superfamily N-acetyltransferase
MLTGPDFLEHHVLHDGTPVVLRHVRPDDAGELRASFDRLSPTSRYRRFMAGVQELSDEMVRYLTQVDGHDHVAIVATGALAGAGAERGLGIARFVRMKDDPTVAEAALTVIDDMQKKGLGRMLAIALARAALERGITHFRGEILADNAPVRALLDEVGATVRPVEEGSLVFDIELLPSEDDASPRFEVVIGRLLRAVASQLAGLVRGLGTRAPPAS